MYSMEMSRACVCFCGSPSGYKKYVALYMSSCFRGWVCVYAFGGFHAVVAVWSGSVHQSEW